MIRTLLIANRGEIAVRVARTARAMGIRTVAVFSDPDADLPHVRAADLAVRLPGAAPAETYLRVDRLLDAAARTGADAVHPGYGFLSENAGFARAVVHAGLTWVGPPADAIEAMGAKLRAKELIVDAGVRTMPSARITPGGDRSDAEAVGFPLLVKASYGGGGRGMRVVRTPADLPGAVESAAREAAAAFGDGTVFVERFAENPRHVEVQVLADAHGTVVHLFERECSIQRRHQKIVEECPSPAVDDELRERLGAAAVTAARAIGYVGAGTVEFLLLSDGSFAFLEVNTRLQVEHPVTELVTGLDLVRLQLEVAEGQPLPAAAREPRMNGHAIEVRLYAEDPGAGWLPQAGRLSTFAVPANAGVRVDSGVESGSVVGVHYDPMLAKVIAHAPRREEAARRLALALERTRVHGVGTNRDLLVRVLSDPGFLAGATDTGFLDRTPGVFAPLADNATRRLHLAAVTLTGAAARRASAPVLGDLRTGWRNNPSQLASTHFEEATVSYQLGRGGWQVEVAGEWLPLTVLDLSADRLVAEVDGVRRTVDVARAGPTSYADSAGGSTVHVELPRFPDPQARLAPGSLTAAMPGSVVRVEVGKGDTVDAGAVLLVLEAMKMEHPVIAPHAGVVTTLAVTQGGQVEAGTVLAVVEPQGE